MKKVVKGTSEPWVPQKTGDKRPIICELTVLNDEKMVYSPFKVQHKNMKKIALHTSFNCQHRPGNNENSGGSQGVSAAGLFEKRSPT